MLFRSNITVTPVNDAPFANGQSVTTPEDTAKAITLTGSDVEGSPLTYSIVAGPTNGTISGFNTNTGAITYRGATNYFGPDFFSYRVSDGLQFATGTVSVTVSPVNDAPLVTAPAKFTVTEDTVGPLVWPAGAAPFADIDSSTLTVTLSVEAGALTGAAADDVVIGGTPRALTFRGTTTNLNALSQANLDALDLTKLTLAQVAGFDSTAITNLTATQVGTLTASEVGALTATEIGAPMRMNGMRRPMGVRKRSDQTPTGGWMRSAANIDEGMPMP